MLVIIPLIYIGRYYFLLAKTHQRNQWGYGFLGAGITFFTQLLTGLLIFVYALVTKDESIYQSASLVSLIAVALSLIVATIVYKQLEKRWTSHSKKDDSLLDH